MKCSKWSLDLETALTSGGNNTPVLDTSLHRGVEQKRGSWLSGILDLTTRTIKTTAPVSCHVTPVLPPLHSGPAVFQEDVMVSRGKPWSCRKPRSSSRDVERREREGGVVCSLARPISIFSMHTRFNPAVLNSPENCWGQDYPPSPPFNATDTLHA